MPQQWSEDYRAGYYDGKKYPSPPDMSRYADVGEDQSEYRSGYERGMCAQIPARWYGKTDKQARDEMWELAMNLRAIDDRMDEIDAYLDHRPAFDDATLAYTREDEDTTHMGFRIPVIDDRGYIKYRYVYVHRDPFTKILRCERCGALGSSAMIREVSVISWGELVYLDSRVPYREKNEKAYWGYQSDRVRMVVACRCCEMVFRSLEKRVAVFKRNCEAIKVLLKAIAERARKEKADEATEDSGRNEGVPCRCDDESI